MTTSARSTLFLTTETPENARISRYERKEIKENFRIYFVNQKGKKKSMEPCMKVRPTGKT